MNARTALLIQEECQKIVSRLAVHGATTRAVTVVVKRLLLNAPYWHNGVHVNPIAKSLGAGVWELHNGDGAMYPNAEK